jgi:hypothetical protein
MHGFMPGTYDFDGGRLRDVEGRDEPGLDANEEAR